MVAPGGYLIVNESMVNREPTRTDIHWLMIPANQIARDLGNERASNMVLLGALEANMKALPEGALERALKEHTAERLEKFVGMNIEALNRGAEYKVE